MNVTSLPLSPAGVIHLEALELLSKECESKVRWLHSVSLLWLLHQQSCVEQTGLRKEPTCSFQFVSPPSFPLVLDFNISSTCWLFSPSLLLFFSLLFPPLSLFLFCSPPLFQPLLPPPWPFSFPWPCLPKLRSRLANLSEEETQSLKEELDKITQALKVEEPPEDGAKHHTLD